ncbi:CoA transferase [Microbispora sp. RL4-1S]|uniref:CoA transferase n=1 Tax=Microbispora oryzae TaxID=2806554 RepID=A0A940WK15_9ACTN|nr:CoA transferase [Microbispora oryzae]MBP2702945.1 CoA transferase [Microbispora oryzae]
MTRAAATATVLTGYTVAGAPRTLAEATCLRHLTDLGATATRHPSRHPGTPMEVAAPDGTTLGVRADWAGPVADGPVDEVTVQARCGLMAVHGRREGLGPRRIGLDYAATAAGVLAATGVLAVLVGRAYGHEGGTVVETSATEAALLTVSHYLAAATAAAQAGDDDGLALLQRALLTEGEPPPFTSADGVLFELECIDADAWRRMWEALGVTAAIAGRCWLTFDLRFPRAEGPLPPELHAAARSRPLAEIAAIAAEAGVSLCRLRSAAERLEELGLREHGRVGPPWTIVPHEILPSAAHPPRTHRTNAGAGPLTGLRVVELGRRIQGPVAGMVLRRLGADVVRIEPPGGEPHRSFPPLIDGCSAPFLAVNGGKEVVQADLRTPRGRDAVRELISGADAFLHNLAPGRADDLGLGAAASAAMNPRLVWAVASAWGDAREPAALHGTDYIVQAYAGLGEQLRPDDERPVPSLMTLLDFLGGLTVAEGVVAALAARTSDGRGRRVESGLLAAAGVLQAPALEDLAAEREIGRRNGRPIWTELDRPLPTAHGFLALPAGTPADRFRRTVPSIEALTTRPADDWVKLLRQSGIDAVTVCEDLADLPADSGLSELLHGTRAAFTRNPWRFE